MEERHWDKDEVAERMFNAPYSRLSAWGRNHVDGVMAKFDLLAPAHSATLKENNPLADTEKLAKELEDLRLENSDLWDQNQELKLELEELRGVDHEY